VARWKLEADETVVSTRGEVGVSRQAGGRDVGGWNAELGTPGGGSLAHVDVTEICRWDLRQGKDIFT
jgi:hypothetical protein